MFYMLSIVMRKGFASLRLKVCIDRDFMVFHRIALHCVVFV